MKILLVGATGGLGTAVGKPLTGWGHQVVTVGRTADMVAEDCLSAYRGKVAVQRA